MNNAKYFGKYGGRFVPKPLEQRLIEVQKAYTAIKKDKKFKTKLDYLLTDFAGRPSPLYLAEKLTKIVGGTKIYLKREDLNHMGAHKINNTLGQALLAKNMGKQKLIAETGAGQHGVATATAAALLDLKCDIYIGKRDFINQNMNVYRMQLLGAKVVTVNRGRQTLKEAVDAALAAYMGEPNAFYCLGSVVGPHPYPTVVRDFQRVIGIEAKKQILQKEGRLPDYLIACVGGGSNAMGLFYHFIRDKKVGLIAVEPAGRGKSTGKHGLVLQQGRPGVLHGFKSKVLQDKKGNVKDSYSAASGLDYPGVGPEPCHLHQIKRLKAVGITDKQAVKAFSLLSQLEGIIPALESAHAVSYALKLGKKLAKNKIIIVNLSGRGDKDVKNVCKNLM
jgi:tryptophan synthase beta chain